MKTYKELQEENEKLQIENSLLRKLIPEEGTGNPLLDLHRQLQKDIIEVQVIKAELEAEQKIMILQRQMFEKEINQLIDDLKASTQMPKNAL
ncbi:MAG: hypothetical protein ACI4TK_14480 [Agathobacter sp.]